MDPAVKAENSARGYVHAFTHTAILNASQIL